MVFPKHVYSNENKLSQPTIGSISAPPTLRALFIVMLGSILRVGTHSASFSIQFVLTLVFERSTIDQENEKLAKINT